MTLEAQATQLREGAIGPTVVPLLAVAVFINYVDRGNLATAAPLIQDELGLSATQIGLLLSAFFWSYVPAQILAGWLSERINPYRTLALGLALFGESPSPRILLGAAIVVASGVFVLWRERRLSVIRRRASVAAPHHPLEKKLALRQNVR